MSRPSSPLLSRDQIAKAALAYVSKHGGLSIPGLAKKLRVHPSSLYYHVPGGKADIIRSARDFLYRDFPLTQIVNSDIDWQQRLQLWMRYYREANKIAPMMIPLLINEQVDDPLTLEIYEALCAVFADAKLKKEKWSSIAAFIDAVCMGSALDTLSPEPLFVPSVEHKNIAEMIRHSSGDRVDLGFDLAVMTVVIAVEKCIEF